MTKWLRTVEKTGSLDDLLLSAIDETSRHVFREAGIKVIYDYLENNFHLRREEIAEKPDVFSAGLERLRCSGAPVMKKKGYEFSDYIEELRKRFEG